MNNISLVGRLAGDPSLRYTEGSTAVVGFVLAIKRPFLKERAKKRPSLLRLLPSVKWGGLCGVPMQRAPGRGRMIPSDREMAGRIRAGPAEGRGCGSFG